MTKAKPPTAQGETCACRFGPNGKETKMCKFHILLTESLIKAEKERDRYKLTLEQIESAVCLECKGSGEIGLADGEVPCPKCFGSGDPTKPGVFLKPSEKQTSDKCSGCNTMPSIGGGLCNNCDLAKFRRERGP